jgi:hypothetical protein
VIVELKRAKRKMKLLELVGQGQLYVRKLEKILNAMGESDPDIEVIFVLGSPLEDEAVKPAQLKASMDSVSPGSRITYYDTLIKGAQDSYSKYLEKSKELDKLEQIVEQL